MLFGCGSAHVSRCMYTSIQMCVWLGLEVEVKNHPGSHFHLIHWGRISQSQLKPTYDGDSWYPDSSVDLLSPPSEAGITGLIRKCFHHWAISLRSFHWIFGDRKILLSAFAQEKVHLRSDLLFKYSGSIGNLVIITWE